MDVEEARMLLRAGKSGVTQWNKLRAEGDEIPDLTGTNLSRCDLIGVDLHGLRLAEALFGGSHLDGAEMTGAILLRADLPASRLCRADFRGANLRQANLRNADVAGADFTDSDLTGTVLQAVSLSSAVLHVCDGDDAELALRRAERLAVSDEIKEALFQIVQKIDVLDLVSRTRQEVAGRVDDLIKELLIVPRNLDRVASLYDVIEEMAPALVVSVSRNVFLRVNAAGR